MTISHDTLDLQHGTSLTGDPPSSPVPPLDMGPHCKEPPALMDKTKTVDLFKLVHLRVASPTSAGTWWLLKHVPMVGKRPARILLEYFLVVKLITMALYEAKSTPGSYAIKSENT